jgi:DNA helicase-2/ATP-dependent DNA helicase PcrA
LNSEKSELDRFLGTLNSAQREAVTSPDGPALVLAGAGSGKTRVLIGRALYLLAHERVNPGAILVMTFTNKAAGELQNRLRDNLGTNQELPWAGTFHGFCARLLRIYGAEIGLSRDFTIYDTEDSERVLAALLAEHRIGKESLTPAKLHVWISLLKNGGRLSYRDSMHKTAESLLPEYNSRLRESQAVDFDDLLSLPLELLVNNPDVRERLRRKYDHILIDEFQDTNRNQYDLALTLAKPQNNLFAVGDDDQSIYGWRGAEPKNILDFQHDLPATRIFRLEQNYRSTQAILDVANDVISHNRNRKEKSLWTEKEGGEKVVLRYASRAMDEANEVIGEIHQLARKRLYHWNDFAVLYRTNALSRNFEEVFIQQAIPYTLVGGVRFYHRKEVKDLVAYLRVLVNPNDEQAWRRVFSVPPQGIGDVTVRRLEELSRNTGLGLGDLLRTASALEELTAGARNKLNALVGKLDSIRQKIASLDLAKIVKLVLDGSGLRAFYAEQDAEDSEDRLANLAQLVEAARDRSIVHPEYDLSEFLTEISLVSDVDDYNETPDRVTLMTVHAAKGLEFPVVFIVGLEENLFPHKRSISDKEIEEERRLFYVGVTRAKERLYLTYSQNRSMNGMLEMQEPSRFLSDIEPAKLRGWTLPPPHRADFSSQDDNGFADSFNDSEFSFRQQSASKQDPVSLLIPYKIGDVVEHPEFGRGIVTAKSGEADSIKVRVAFEGMGSKLLAIKFAPLKKIR